jgi:hypothetical protein
MEEDVSINPNEYHKYSSIKMKNLYFKKCNKILTTTNGKILTDETKHTFVGRDICDVKNIRRVKLRILNDITHLKYLCRTVKTKQ